MSDKPKAIASCFGEVIWETKDGRRTSRFQSVHIFPGMTSDVGARVRVYPPTIVAIDQWGGVWTAPVHRSLDGNPPVFKRVEVEND